MKSVRFAIALASFLSWESIVRAEDGFFSCDPVNGDQCALRKSVVANSQAAYLSEFDLRVVFNCQPGNYSSNLQISADDFATFQTLTYGKTYELLPLKGTGPIKIRDTKPRATANDSFYPGCGLSIDLLRARPSSEIKDGWLVEADTISTSIINNIHIYDTSFDVNNYYKLYGEDSATATGIIQLEIDRLSALPARTTEEETLLSALNAIVANLSFQQVMQPYEAIKTKIQDLYNRGTTLKNQLRDAAGLEKANLNDALNLASERLQN